MPDIEYLNGVKDKLNRIELEGFENVLAGDVLHYPVYGICDWKEQESFIRVILRYVYWSVCILKRMSSEYFDVVHPENSRTLFLFSSSYAYRDDLCRGFCQVIDLFPDSSHAIAKTKPVKPALHKLRWLKRVFQWYFALKKEGLCRNRLERLYLVKELCIVYSDYLDVKAGLGQDFESLENLVSFCDIHASDSFFVQKFHAQGKRTVDLMHGSIGFGSNAWSVYGIKSRYFIADSQYTKDMLIESGYKGEVFVCGYVYSIQKDKGEVPLKAEKVIGVVFSASGLHDDNVALCKKLSFLEESGYKLIAKLHPTETGDSYPGNCLHIFSKIYAGEITSGDFLDKINYAVISPSTVIYETINHDIPFIIVQDNTGIYKEYGMPESVISGEGELEAKVNDMLDGNLDSEYESLRDYYTPQGNVRDNYITTFHGLGIY